MTSNLFSAQPFGRASVGHRRTGTPSPPPMLAPTNAWRILNARTGGTISRPTFYRWLSNGKICSVRVGYRLYVPWPALAALIAQCLAGERIGR